MEVRSCNNNLDYMDFELFKNKIISSRNVDKEIKEDQAIEQRPNEP
jgi:hypothetical protein